MMAVSNNLRTRKVPRRYDNYYPSELIDSDIDSNHDEVYSYIVGYIYVVYDLTYVIAT